MEAIHRQPLWSLISRRDIGMETLTEMCRRINAACETVAHNAIQAGDDRKADAYLRVAFAYRDIADALDSEHGARLMEMVQ
jgi:hypothetical protein